jgi:SMC interacting uncharacterized protein involved in chromosome segregation
MTASYIGDIKLLTDLKVRAEKAQAKAESEVSDLRGALNNPRSRIAEFDKLPDKATSLQHKLDLAHSEKESVTRQLQQCQLELQDHGKELEQLRKQKH